MNEEANKNFKQYIEDYLLKKVDFNEHIYNKFYENSLESLRVASKINEEGISPLWVIVSSYYSMFYIASAYIYKKGYKAQHKIVHKIVNDTLIVLAKDELTAQMIKEYEEEKDKALSIAENILDSLEYERAKRSMFQYEMTEDLKESKSKTSLKRAKEFVSVFRKVLS